MLKEMTMTKIKTTKYADYLVKTRDGQNFWVTDKGQNVFIPIYKSQTGFFAIYTTNIAHAFRAIRRHIAESK